MKIISALRQLNLLYPTTASAYADDDDALQTAKRSLQEWNELLEECGRVAIRDREDLFTLVKKHIARIEGEI